MSSFDFGGEFVWRPTPELIAQSNLQRLMQRHALTSLDELQTRSTTELDWFWNAVLDDLNIEFYQPYTRVLDLSRGAPWSQWCVGGKLNIVRNCLDKYAGTSTDAKLALRWEGEDGATRSRTYAELRREVNRLAGALRGMGLGRGDAVAVFMPMTPEIVVAMLAIIKLGGLFVPLFSGFGAQAIALRLNDAAAKALITADGTQRRGRVVPMLSTASEAVAQSPTVQDVIVLSGKLPDLQRIGEANWPTASTTQWHRWRDLVATQPDNSPTEHTDAEEPLMLIYTSGTTGAPKGAVHTHCGFPIKAAQDIAHGLDLHTDEVLYWVTDMGWMMGPWLVFGALLLGATMMLYDGALDFPGPDRLWALVERHGVTSLGVSPTLIRSLLPHGDAPVRAHDLSSLRKFASTGEPWNPEPWRWLFEVVGQARLPIINYSGGTEISGGIVMGNVLTPLKPCAFAGPVPGIAADVVDEHGASVRGQVGELVIRQPWIGMTRGFWNAPERYLETYWSRWPDVWVHGDWAAVDSDGLWYILGRSDDTIKLAGKRLGPAEVESVLVEHEGVIEAAAIGVPDEMKGDALVCFCVLAPGVVGSDTLRTQLREQVIRALGKALAPRTIEFVADLPKTRSAKIMRRVIRATYLGLPPGDLTALENPSAVEAIRATMRIGA